MLKKILTQEDRARKKKKNQILVGGVLIVLMVVSTLGYSLMSGDSGVSNRVSEVGVDFVREGGLWKIDFGGVIFGFQYLPSEVDDVFVSGDYYFENYSNEVLYFVNGNEGVSEILNNFGRYVLRYQDACLRQAVTGDGSWVTDEATECDGDLPKKSCDSNLIIFEDGNETMIWRNESCVYIVGDAVRGADAFLYKALKIT